jgi:type II secretory pathway pseudopilin PulG
MKKPFSLVELICVAIILAIMSTVLMPVFASARLSSKASSAKANLRTFWQGMILYQSNYDEKVPFGRPEDMGLPPTAIGFSKFVNAFTKDNNNSWDTKSKFLPCGKSVGDEEIIGLGYMPLIRNDWNREVTIRQGNTVLIFDKNCNLPDTRVMCQFCDKRSIGITLSGAIKDRINADWKVYDQHFYQ